MSVLNAEVFHEGIPSELGLFDLPETQVGVQDIYYVEIRPLSQVTQDSPIEFNINTSNSADYLDLKGSQLYLKCQVKKADGTNIGSAEKVGPVNLFLQALFSTTEVTLQDKVTVTCNYNSFTAIIKTLLNFGESSKNTQVTNQLFMLDDYDHPEDPDPSGGNSGLLERAKPILGSKTVALQGPLFHDFFQIPRYLLNQVSVKVKLYRNSPAFALLSGEASPDYRIDIVDIYLLARKVKVNPAIIYSHNEILKSTNAKYFYPKTDTRIQSVPAGATSFHWENLYQGQKPNKVVVGFVKSVGTSGNYKTNPFDFQNLNITSAVLSSDGIAVSGSVLKTSFKETSGLDIARAYTNLFLLNNTWNKDSGNDISKERFVRGSTLFAFDLDPFFDQFLPLIKTGNITLDIQFGTALSDTMACVVMSEFQGYFEINQARDILFP